MLNLSPATIVSRIITLIVAFSVHEFSHAWTADSFGDDTPRMAGRLTLNPAVHLDLMGTLMLLVAGFGWARPVPINTYALRRRSPSAVMWVSLAGPFSNLLLAALAAVPLRMGLVEYSTTNNLLIPSPFSFLLQFITINLELCIFNVIPLAPQDGEKIVEFFFPPSWNRFMDTIRPYGPLILMGLLFILPMIGIDLISLIMQPAIIGLARLLIG